jgi:hypothetical protein
VPGHALRCGLETSVTSPSRPQGVSPGFRASLVQPSASLRPFYSRFASFQGWEIPLPLRLLPPAFARRRSACMYTPPPELRTKAVQQPKEEAPI